MGSLLCSFACMTLTMRYYVRIYSGTEWSIVNCATNGASREMQPSVCDGRRSYTLSVWCALCESIWYILCCSLKACTSLDPRAINRAEIHIVPVPITYTPNEYADILHGRTTTVDQFPFYLFCRSVKSKRVGRKQCNYAAIQMYFECSVLVSLDVANQVGLFEKATVALRSRFGSVHRRWIGWVGLLLIGKRLFSSRVGTNAPEINDNGTYSKSPAYMLRNPLSASKLIFRWLQKRCQIETLLFSALSLCFEIFATDTNWLVSMESLHFNKFNSISQNWRREHEFHRFFFFTFSFFCFFFLGWDAWITTSRCRIKSLTECKITYSP